MGNLIIVPICGVSEDMEGFNINGWEIKKLLPTSDANSILPQIADSVLYKEIRFFLDTDSVINILPFTNDFSNPYYMVFIKETEDISDLEPIVDVLRVFKSSMFGCAYPLHYSKGRVLPYKEGHSYTTNALSKRNLLSFTADEKAQVLYLLRCRIKKSYPPIVNTMLSFLHDSCHPSNLYLGYISQVTIIEMLVDGNTELSYRMKHHLSVFLGHSKDESVQIGENFKKIYDARSKLLHSGDPSKITDDLLELAFEYSRRLIANLLCVTDDIKTVRTKLEQSGYGDNPYHTIF